MGQARLGDLAGGGGQDGVLAGLGDHGSGRARGDGGAGQAQGRRVQHPGGAGRPGRGRLFQPARPGPGIGGVLGDGHRLAGEGGLVQGQTVGGDDPAVSGDHVPGAEQDQVAGGQQPGVAGPGNRAIPGAAAGMAQHRDPGCGEVAQAGEQVIKAPRLVQPQPHAGRQHHGDQHHAQRVAGQRHDRVESGQQNHERAAHAGPQGGDAPGGELIDAMLCQAGHDLGLGQARLTRAQPPQRLPRRAGGQLQQLGGGGGPGGVEQRIVGTRRPPEGEGAARAQRGVHPASSWPHDHDRAPGGTAARRTAQPGAGAGSRVLRRCQPVLPHDRRWRGDGAIRDTVRPGGPGRTMLARRVPPSGLHLPAASQPAGADYRSVT